MKLPANRVEAFLRRPDPETRAILLFGPDTGLVRERADNLARGICPELRDPFRVADLTAGSLTSDPAQLYDEAAQISMMGGRRVVRVRDAGDTLAPLFTRFLADASGDAMVIVEAGDLPGRSSLRRVFDDAVQGAAIGCYPDSARDLAGVIRDSFAAHRINVTRDATDFLVAHLGGDRLLTRAELEKLALYAGDGGSLDLDDVHAVLSDSAGLSMDDALLAAAEGNTAALDRALARVFQEGESPVSIIRALLRHLHRLHQLALRVAGGSSPDEVIRGARPPIFFKQQDSYRRQLTRWNEPRLRRALDRAANAEFRMKLTGFPAETICREALFAIAREAQASSAKR